MLPLSKDCALELTERDVTVYMLYSDNTESMVLDTEDIITNGKSALAEDKKPSVLEQLKTKETTPKMPKSPKKTKENER